MQTDWLIVRRLAVELDRALRGQRIREAGIGANGTFVVRFARHDLELDVFADSPIVLLHPPEGTLGRDLWWTREISEALGGMRVESIRARRGDRLIAVDCAAQSRFGVANRYRLVVELTPRFGNVLLLKDDTVVTAAKEFPRSKGRATLAGELYEPPPLPSGEFPRLVAQSLEALRQSGSDEAAARVLARAAVDDDAALGPIHAYRRGEELVAAHVLPLAQHADLSHSLEPELLPLLAGSYANRRVRSRDAAEQALRERLRGKLKARIARLEAQRAKLERERDDEPGRIALRRGGELLYAHASSVSRGATSFTPPDDPTFSIPLDPGLDAKANAAAIFKRYRKATNRVEHHAARAAQLGNELVALEELDWELERSDGEALKELAEAFEPAGRRQAPAKRHRARPLPPIEIPLAEDARVYVGRSPRGNAELTFRMARPDDLWFHAQRVPGAHVVLRIDGAREPSDDELVRAAEAAAFHSKARSATVVNVDYTERKHVRKQRNADDGLVWYDNAHTLSVRPRT